VNYNVACEFRRTRKDSDSQIAQEADHKNHDAIYVDPKNKKQKVGPFPGLASMPDDICAPARAQLANKAVPSLLVVS
jgi:hypothetical protein